MLCTLLNLYNKYSVIMNEFIRGLLRKCYDLTTHYHKIVWQFERFVMTPPPPPYGGFLHRLHLQIVSHRNKLISTWTLLCDDFPRIQHYLAFTCRNEAPDKATICRLFNEFNRGRSSLTDEISEGRPISAVLSNKKNIDAVIDMC